MKKRYIASFLFLGTVTSLLAQVDSVQNNQSDFKKSYELYKNYQHIVKNVNRLENRPHFSDTNFIPRTFTYDLPVLVNDQPSIQKGNIERQLFNPVSSDGVGMLYNNYALVGYETKHAPFAEVSFYKKVDDFGIGAVGFYKTDNQQNNQIPYLGYRKGGLKVYTDYHGQDLNSKAHISYQSRTHYLADLIAGSDFYARDKVGYDFFSFEGQLSPVSKKSFLKNISIAYDYAGLEKHAANNRIDLKASLAQYLILDKMKWHVDGSFTFSENSFENASFSSNNMNLFVLRPGISGYLNKLHYRLGIKYLRKSQSINQTGETDSYYPELSVQYTSKYHTFFGGFEVDHRINDYHQLVRTNPFLTRGVQTVNTRISPFFFGGIKGVYKDFDYQLSGRYFIGGEFLFFDKMQTTVNGYLKNSYTATHLEGDKFEVSAKIKYPFSSKLSLNAEGLFQVFNLANNQITRHTPVLTLMAATEYRFTDDFTAYGSAKISSEQEFVIIDPLADISGSKSTTAIFDLSVGAKYDFDDQWRGFLEVNNLLNREYEIWQNYGQKGIFLRGGIRFKF
ncbi:MAG: hypothetical protein N4A45_10210 [Flavobacteriales bacterium]|nr:hypothetical protein [Flavobacteriales bacterium]